MSRMTLAPPLDRSLFVLAFWVLACCSGRPDNELLVHDVTVVSAERPAPTSSNETATGDLVFVPAGSFLMGSRIRPDEIQSRFGYDFTEGAKDGWSDQLPAHEVKVSAFLIDRYEVTNAQYQMFIDATGYVTEAEKEGWGFAHTAGRFGKQEGITWRQPGWDIEPTHPVVLVSWRDAMAYIDWLNETTEGRLRLPTEAEWEYAARAGTETNFFWGDDPARASRYANVLDAYFDIDDGHPFTAPVGSYEPNPWGLYDMTGNVWEWCEDLYIQYVEVADEDPPGTATSDRVDRGGAWDSPRYNARIANRGSAGEGFRAANLGFRLARNHQPER